MSDRPTQNSQNNSKPFNSSSSSINSSTGSINGATNGSNMNFLATGQGQQQQQQQRNGGNNVRPPPQTINRQGGNSLAGGIPQQNSTTDFISFLNANSGGNSSGNSQPNPQTSNGNNATPGANINALNRLETIRQYYMQLSNNLRLITQQLQSSDLTASRRQALLMEQARANAAMQEFTEKILKPISASKQQQQQAQAQAQAQQQAQQQQQQHQQQRTPFNNQAGPAQMMQYQGRPPVPQQQHQPMKNTTPSSVPASNFIPQMNQGPQGIPQTQPPQSQRPPQMNSSVNLYSQSGLGMIRPIINAAPSSGANRPGTAVNFRPSGPMSVPSAPQSVPPIPAGSPQRSFRPPTAVNVPISQLNANINQQQNTPPTAIIPPSKLPNQQFIVNRQTYLMAAQQHQTSVTQQQILFQQRLSLFSRDQTSNISPSQKKIKRANGKAPILALPPVLNRPVTSPIRGKVPSFPLNSAVPFSNYNSRSTSFPSSYAIGAKLKDLAKQFKLELSDGAEKFLLRIADEFVDCLARKSISFASHRKRKVPTLSTSTVSSKTKKMMSHSATTESVEEVQELNVTVEDLMLGLDELINYQPAGNGSIENCRPMVKRTKESGGVGAGGGAGGAGGGTESTVTATVSNHQHRLTMVKKHSSMYQYY